MDRQSMQRLNGLRILVVDDAAIQRECAMAVLDSEGAQVSLANDGQQALAWLRAHGDEIDLVLMDMQMPVMDGLAAIHAIRAIPAFIDLPVIALTAGEHTTQNAKAAGMTDILSKPFDVEAVVATILGSLNREKALASGDTRAHTAISAGAGRQYPGISVEQGMAIWADEDVYRQHLRDFARDFEHCTIELAQIERLDAAKRAHEMCGIAGVLGLTDIAALAAQVERTLRKSGAVGGSDDPEERLRELQRAMQTTLESIRCYTSTGNP